MGIGNCRLTGIVSQETKESTSQENTQAHQFVLADEEVVFSCESCWDTEDRELFLTPNSIVIRCQNKGEFVPIGESSIKFDESANGYRVALDKYGLHISENSFKEFWSELSSIRSN